MALIDDIQGAAEGIDFSKPANLAMLSAWVAAGALSIADHDSLIAIATHPDQVDEMDVRRACWSDFGEWVI